MKKEEFLSRLAEAFNTPVSGLSLDSTQQEIEGWDSMGSINLISLIQEEFSLNLSMDELAGLDSIRDIFSLLEKNGIEFD